MTPDPVRDILLSDDLQRVDRVEPSLGNRSLVTGSGTGSDAGSSDIPGIAREVSGNLVAVDEDLDAVFRVNRSNGFRTILSGGAIGQGPVLQTPDAIATATHWMPEPRAIAIAVLLLLGTSALLRSIR